MSGPLSVYKAKWKNKVKVEQRRNAQGKQETWVKVYKEEDGVLDFEEGDTKAVTERRTVDDGKFRLRDNQQQDAVAAASTELFGGSKGNRSLALSDLTKRNAPSLPKETSDASDHETNSHTVKKEQDDDKVKV